MSMYFYSKKEDIIKGDKSLNDQAALREIFEDYNHFPPSLHDALNEVFSSTGINDKLADKFTKEILSKSKKILESTYDLIMKYYPYLSEEESLIITSYKCEFDDPNYRNYSPYKIMNIKLCENGKVYIVYINIFTYF